MHRKEKAALVKRYLDHYFPHPQVSLNHTSPYTLLIATLLSAQSTDLRVNQITPALFTQASTPEEMVQLSIEEIQTAIRPCGLSHQKALAIWQLSCLLITCHQGRVPHTFEELEALPHVGHKTASVVLSQAFGIPAFPVDTHIFRCAHRWGLSSGKNVVEVELDLKHLFYKKDWSRVHLQMIHYARLYCPSRSHFLEKCPICSALQTV